MSDDGPVYALVLSGGGARGAFDAGVVVALEEAGIRPRVVSGTSAGALTGAAVACGWSAARTAAVWTRIRTRDVMRFRKDVHRLVRPSALLRDPRPLLGAGHGSTSDRLLGLLGWTWFLHQDPLRELLVEELGGERLPVRHDATLTLSAVAVESGQPVRFCNRPVPEEARDHAPTVVAQLTVDHMLASAAIPGVFRPVEIDGVDYWDGGLTSNTPVTAALEHAPDRVIVVGTTPEEAGERPPRSIGDVVALAISHVFRDALVQDIDAARTLNAVADRSPETATHRAVEIATVHPSSHIDGLGDLLDFQPRRATQLVEEGRRRTRRMLRRNGWGRA